MMTSPTNWRSNMDFSLSFDGGSALSTKPEIQGIRVDHEVNDSLFVLAVTRDPRMFATASVCPCTRVYLQAFSNSSQESVALQADISRDC